MAVCATAFDFDNLLPDDMMGGADVDPSVSYVGFASDSLHGTHEFGSGAMGGVLSGDPTSVVQLLFRKSPQTAVATPIAERWFAVPFDLGQEGNAIVAQAGGTVGIINPAADTLESGDTTGTRIVVSDATVLSTATGAGSSAAASCQVARSGSARAIACRTVATSRSIMPPTMRSAR